MNCVKCGTKLEKDEFYCSKCGANIGTAENANLVITRPGKVIGCAVKLMVTVDGVEYPLAAGGRLDLCLSEGVHNVKYNIWCRREKNVDVTIEKGKVASIIFTYDFIWGGFKVNKKSNL